MTATLNMAYLRPPEMAADDVACMDLVLEIARLNVINGKGGRFSALLREDVSGRIISMGDLRHSPAHKAEGPALAGRPFAFVCRRLGSA